MKTKILFIFVLVVIILSSLIFFQFRKAENVLSEKESYISELQQSIEEKNDVIDKKNTELKQKNEELKKYESDLIEIKKELDDLQKENLKLRSEVNTPDYDVWTYKIAFKNYRALSESLLVASEIDNDYVSINGIHIGHNSKNVKESFGDEYTEVIELDESNGWTDITWYYNDGTSVSFNSVYVSSVKTTNPNYSTNIGIKIGDSALQTLNYCNERFEKVNGIHIDEPLLGWYWTEKGNILILYFNEEGNRFQQDIKINEETKIEKIEVIIPCLN